VTNWLISPYFNEAEVFEIRLAELGDWADVIVVTEGNRTYAGSEREYDFPKNAKRWKPWADKIRYVEVDLPIYPGGIEGLMPMQAFQSIHNGAWMREQTLRGEAVKLMEDLHSSDPVLISDADEIVRREVVEREARNLYKMGVIRFNLPQHVLYLNWRWQEEQGAVARLAEGKMIRDFGLQAIARGGYDVLEGEDLGWHFAYMGGPERVLYKIQEAAHIELARYAIEQNVANSYKTGMDLFGRGEFQAYSVEDSALPEYVQKHKTKFKSLMGRDIHMGGVVVGAPI
jgi:hypothetical protein